METVLLAYFIFAYTCIGVVLACCYIFKSVREVMQDVKWHHAIRMFIISPILFPIVVVELIRKRDMIWPDTFGNE